MNPSPKPLTRLFWNRLLLLIIFISGAYLGQKFLRIPHSIDPSLVFSIVLIGGIIAWYIFFRIIEKPFLTLLFPLTFLFWLILDKLLIRTIHFSPKPHLFVLGFILLSGIMIFYKHLNYLWQFKTVRFLSIFAAINLIYFFFHSSDFNVATHGYMYGWGGKSADKDAKLIVFIDSIATFLSFCIPAIIFSKINSKQELDKIINRLGYVFLFGYLAIFLLFPITFKSMPTGIQVFLPLNFFFLLSFKLYLDNNFNKDKWFNFGYSCILLGISFLIILNSNKAAFIGFIAALTFFLFVNFKFIKYRFKILSLEKTTFLAPIVIFILLIAVYILAEKFHVIDLIINKYYRITSSFSGITSWYIRKNNWYYFLLDWKNHLDLFNILFGFGLGASRETIFYISAMQYSPIYLVQTVHNQFLEMFYDYGLVSMLFYLPVLGIAIKDFITIQAKNAAKNIKLFSTVNLCMFIFFLFYHITDGLRVETAVILFSFLGFNEMAKQRIVSFTKNL